MTTTAADYLKYLANHAVAMLESAMDSIAANGFDAPQYHSKDQLERDLDLLAEVRDDIREAADVICRDQDDLLTYSDGRRVATSCDIEDGHYFTNTTHPNPGHPLNQPRMICTTNRRDGTQMRILLHANGDVEAVPVERLRVVK